LHPFCIAREALNTLHQALCLKPSFGGVVLHPFCIAREALNTLHQALCLKPSFRGVVLHPFCTPHRITWFYFSNTALLRVLTGKKKQWICFVRQEKTMNMFCRTCMFYCPWLVLNPQSLNKKTTFLSIGYFQAQNKIGLFFLF
jgi:hypothetical protein